MLIPWAHYEPQTIFKITMVSIMLDKLIILVHWLIFSLSLGLIGAGVQASFYKGGFYLIIVGLCLSIKKDMAVNGDVVNSIYKSPFDPINLSINSSFSK